MYRRLPHSINDFGYKDSGESNICTMTHRDRIVNDKLDYKNL